MYNFAIIFSIVLLCFMWLMSNRAQGYKRNSEWLYSALSSIGDSIITTDAKGMVRSLNESAEKLTGWSTKDAMGKPAKEVFRMVVYDTRTKVEDPVSAVLATGMVSEWAHNNVLISRTGSECIIDNSAAPLRGPIGGVQGVMLIFRNITERYAAEQQLLESEERLKAITNAARIGLVMIDRERRYVYANNFYMHMLNISSASLLGKRVADAVPEVYEKISPNLDRAFAGERVSYEVNGLHNKEKGLNRIYRITYEPQQRHSLVTHVVIVVLDITDIKRSSDPSPQI
jgi:PAS domain S-box-containing protein